MKPCVVCGAPTEWWEPRFGYYACVKHKNLSPTEVKPYLDHDLTYEPPMKEKLLVELMTDPWMNVEDLATKFNITPDEVRAIVTYEERNRARAAWMALNGPLKYEMIESTASDDQGPGWIIKCPTRELAFCKSKSSAEFILSSLKALSL